MEKAKALELLKTGEIPGMAEIVISREGKYYIISCPERSDGAVCYVYDYDYNAEKAIEVGVAYVNGGTYFELTNAHYMPCSPGRLDPFDKDENGNDLYEFYSKIFL